MFTSRAEFRLQLREDNADMRLTELGRQIGLVDDLRWDAFNRKRDAVSRETERLRTSWVRPATLPAEDAERFLGKALEHEYCLADLLRRPGVDFDAVSEIGKVALARQSALRVGGPAGAAVDAAPDASPSAPGAVSRETLSIDRAVLSAELGAALANAVIEQVEISIKYAGYIDKQNEEVQRAAAYEHLKLPDELDYTQVSALSHEVRQKLMRHRPETLGQASRISGVTPAAISLLLIHLKRGRFKGFMDAAAARGGAA
jgi:tRNA uridine 5-carboxymethylaminomethyl modification enzyme